jgi:hypothetical protein
VNKLKMGVPTKLRPSFVTALGQRLERGELPAGVSVLAGKQKKLLYLDRFPPPPPAEVTLAKELLEALHARRQAGGGAYPLTLAQLVTTVRPGADTKLVQTAVALPEFSQRALFALPAIRKQQRSGSPIALAEDREVLAGSALVLEMLVTLSRTHASQAVSEADLKKKLIPNLFDSFRQSLTRRLQARSWPVTIGCLLQKNKPLLFLLSDLQGPKNVLQSVAPPLALPETGPVSPVASGRTTRDLARLFDEAFERLDRERGHNFVNLVDLRRAVPTDRATFDTELQNLRRAGRYTLSGAEGRDGISPEENLAGIREEGSLLLYVSRRLS